MNNNSCSICKHVIPSNDTAVCHDCGKVVCLGCSQDTDDIDTGMTLRVCYTCIEGGSEE